jgi:acyl carrier protein
MPDANPISSRLKRLIVDALRLPGITPAEIGDDMPLFGEGLGLDSIDALELVVAMEKEFGIRLQIQEVGREAFASVRTLTAFLEVRLADAAPPPEADPPGRRPLRGYDA